MNSTKSYWNYRVVERGSSVALPDYSILEVHYQGDKVVAWTDPVSNKVEGYETAQELKIELEYMLEAFKRPILVIDDLTEKVVGEKVFDE